MSKIVIPIAVITFLYLFVPKTFAAISFSVSNPQTDGDKITLDVSISGLTSSSCPNVSCYLQAAFTSQNQTKYLGFTQNHLGEWYKYDGSPDPDYIKSTFFAFEPTGGSWSGKLTIKVDPEDSDYGGPGSYNIKAWRYSGNSSSSSGSSDNTLAVVLTTSAPSPSPSPPPSPSAITTSSTSAKSPSPSPKSSPSPTPTLFPVSIKSPSPAPKSSASVLGEKDQESPSATPSAGPSESPSPSPQAESTSRVKIAGLVSGTGLILIGVSFGLYLWYSKRLPKSPPASKEDDKSNEKFF